MGLTSFENSVFSLPDRGIVSILEDSDVDDENPASGTMGWDRIRAQIYQVNTFLSMTVSAS